MILRKSLIHFGYLINRKLKLVNTNQWGSIISKNESLSRTNPNIRKRVLELKENLKPFWLSRNSYLRIGSKNDGGYYVPRIVIENSKVLISGGIGDNNDFEFSLANSGMRGIQIDNSIEKAPKRHKNLEFIHATLGEKDFDLNKLINTHEDILLKLDIEGGEYQTLLQIKSFNNITGMIIEFHHLTKLYDLDFYRKLKKVLKKIMRDFLIVHSNPNNAGGCEILGNQLVPNVVEVIFMKRKYKSRFRRMKKCQTDNIENDPDLAQLERIW